MKILVTGDRNWDSIDVIRRALQEYPGKHTLIHGTARGADMIAHQIGIERGWTIQSFPADWKAHGKAAGPIRNQQMLDENPDIVLAFHDNLAISKGTRDMVNRAMARGVTIRLFHSKNT